MFFSFSQAAAKIIKFENVTKFDYKIKYKNENVIFYYGYIILHVNHEQQLHKNNILLAEFLLIFKNIQRQTENFRMISSVPSEVKVIKVLVLEINQN